MRIKRVLGVVMTGVLFLYLTACGEDNASGIQMPSVQLAVVNREPVKLEDGKVYSYDEGGNCYILDLGDYMQSSRPDICFKSPVSNTKSLKQPG